MHAGRVEWEVVEQGLAGLEFVAVRIAGGHETLVAPEHVEVGPVDVAGGLAHQFQQGDAGAAAGEHHRRRPAQPLRLHHLGDEAGGRGGHEFVCAGVGLDGGLTHR